MSEKEITRRNMISREYNLAIRSYDHLSDNLMKREFHTTSNPTNIVSHPTFYLRNQHFNEFANPFASAISFQDWKELIISTNDEDEEEIVINKIEKFFKKRKYSRYFKRFKEIYDDIPEKELDKIIKKL